MSSGVSEVLKEWGSWRLEWVPDVPVSIRAAADTEVFTFSSVKVFDAYVGKETAKVMTPLWTGILMRSDSGSISGPGPAWLAGSGGGSIWSGRNESGPFSTTAITRNGLDGSLNNWTADAVGNTVSGLAVGYVGGAGAGTTQAGTITARTLRTILDSFISPAFGVDWRVNSQYQLDVGYSAQLWPDVGRPVATPTGGRDGARVGMLTSSLGLNTDWEEWVSRTVVQASNGTNYLSTSQSLKKNPADGSNLNWRRIEDASSTTALELQNSANWGFLAESGRTRSAELSVREYGIAARVPVGSYIDVWDPVLGFYDRSNPVEFRGDTIFPVRIRVVGSDWPIQLGMGVWLDRRNITGDPEDLVDLTPYVQLASVEEDTRLTLGRPPKGIGRRVN